jgi:Fuc2NAc and GlcNAc transferase
MLGSHGRVSLAVAGINVVWLWPMALLVGAGRVPPLIGLVLAFAPLVWLAFRFKAGAPELQANTDAR